jgi:hypothetical protein
VYNNRRHVYALRLPSIVTETTTQMRRPRPLAMGTWLWRSEITLLKSRRIQMLMFGVSTRRARMAALWHSSFGQSVSRMEVSKPAPCPTVSSALGVYHLLAKTDNHSKVHFPGRQEKTGIL